MNEAPEFASPPSIELTMLGFQNDVFNAMAASVQAQTGDDTSGVMAIAAGFALHRWLLTRCPAEDREKLRDTVLSMIKTPFASHEDDNAEQSVPAG